MRIALVAPIDETVPPAAYGGIEQIVHLLDRELSQRGHEVFLLANGGSQSSGVLVPVTEGPLVGSGQRLDGERLASRKSEASRFASSLLKDLQPDVVLNHSWRLLDQVAPSPPFPMLTTIHYPLDAGRYRAIFLARAHARYVSISKSQQDDARDLRFAGNVYNGVDLEALPFSANSDGYLAFLGRVHPQKGLDIAIRVAQEIGMPLRVAAKIDREQQAWFETVVGPMMRRGGVELIGEVDAAERASLLGGASALLHPSRWSEPFGLAIIEAMACGTPVVALRRGAAPELIAQGTTGLVVDNEPQLVAALSKVLEFDRSACREQVEKQFTYARMTTDYETLIQSAAK